MHLSKSGDKKFASLVFTLLQQYKIVSKYPKLVPVSSVVCKSFILSQRICEVDPPCYVTVDASTIKNEKYSSSYYNVNSVTNVKVCNFFVSCQSACEVIPIHVVVHVTTNVIVRHWNEISLGRPRIFPAPVTHIENVITYVSKSRKADCPRITSYDASSTADPDPIDAFKSCDEIEGSTLILLPMLKKNVEVFVSFLFMIFVFNLRMIFIFCPFLIFRFSLFIANSILTFCRYCYDFIYTDIAYMIYYNFLTVLTNSLSDIPSMFGSCFYVFHTMFSTFYFLHPTKNLIQCCFQRAGTLFFGLWCFCIISKRIYVLNNFQNYFHAKAFQTPLTILFNDFWLCLLKFLPYLLFISFFLLCVYYILSVFHVSYLHVCFVSISSYIPTEIPT